jgi:UDP-GlcNAc:undecaprenyl-phosphate GlcNAc-1-phosphate transferase
VVIESIFFFFLALLLIKLVIRYGPEYGFVDTPNGRSSHRKAMPISAGIGMYGAVVVGVALFDFELLCVHFLTALALFLVFVVGVLDDHRDTSPRTKFFVIAVATVLMVLDGITLHSLGTLFGVTITLGWLSLPFTLFAVIGYTNALNLLDGLDGLAGSVSLIILVALFSVGYTHGDQFMIMLSAVFISVLAAFLAFNWHPAKIFMGDSGSLVLGFVISVLAIRATEYIHPVSVLFLVSLPVFDTLIVMIRRKVAGQSMFTADKTHIHHLLFNFFEGDTKRTVIFLAIFQMIYSLTALEITQTSNETVILMLFILNTIILYLVFSEMLKRQKRMGKGY